MGSKAKELAPITVSRLTSPGVYFVGGLAGLALQALPIGGTPAGRVWPTSGACGAKDVTFEQAARSYIAAHESGWRNAKHGQQWRNTLASYAYPKIGGL